MAAPRWTSEEDEWLREHYPHHSLSVLERMYAEFFPGGNHRTGKAIGSRAKVLHVAKDERYVANPPTFWTPEKREWFISFVPGHEEREISAEHERLYGTPLKECQIGNAKKAFGVKSGTKGGCFKKGQTPQNKGKTWDEIGYREEAKAKMRATCFKKGEVHDRPDGWIKPLGYERINKYGYVEVKVMDSIIDGIQPKEPGNFNRNYRMKHHIVYEQHHGEIPKGHNIVFADGDKRNFDPSNLIAVPRGVWSTIKRLRIPYSDAESLQTAMALARLSQVRRETKSRVRKARKEKKRK